MIDETGTQSTAAEPTGAGAGSSDAVVAFCQQCGRALTASTRRQIGTGVFCEPCATLRQTPGAGWNTVNAGAVPSSADVPPAGEPNPALAGFLGLIPGVGAMYNGQYGKGVIHLIVFVVLVSLADNLNWVFWWFVWGWIFYQAFEAYHTAQARRDGMPVPDPFGWNELGERLGFTRAPHPGTSPRPVRTAGFQPSTPPPPPAPAPFAQTVYAPAAPMQYPAMEVPAMEASAMGAPAPPFPPPPPSSAPSATSMPFGQVPYSSTFTGTPPPPVGAAPYGSAGQSSFTLPGQRFPVGAVWLIGLGILFLLGNILPAWRINGRWLVPILLAGIALWIGGRRLATWQEPGSLYVAGTVRPSLAGSLLWPCLLLTVATLLAMQDADWIPLRHSWPALLIVWGALLLLGRTQSPTLAVPAASTPLSSVVPPSTDISPR